MAQIPVEASFPVQPPLGNFAFGYVKDGLVYWNPPGYQFIQQIWAAIQGSGGVLDQALIAGSGTADLSRSLTADEIAAASSVALMGVLATRLAAQAPDIWPPHALRAPALADSVVQFPPARAQRQDGMLGYGTMVPWTPTLEGNGTAGTQTYTIQAAFYCEVGPFIVAPFMVFLSAFDGTTAGNMYVRGLPIISSSVTGLRGQAYFSYWGKVTLGAGFTHLGALMDAGTGSIGLVKMGDATAAAAIVAADMAADTALAGVAIYAK